jgi:hypothetical protein
MIDCSAGDRTQGLVFASKLGKHATTELHLQPFFSYFVFVKVSLGQIPRNWVSGSKSKCICNLLHEFHPVVCILTSNVPESVCLIDSRSQSIANFFVSYQEMVSWYSFNLNFLL